MALIPDPNGLSDRFRQILTSHKLTVRAAAERLDQDLASVEGALNGDPTLSVLVCIVREFAVDPTWLLTGEYNRGTHQAALDDALRSVHDVVKRLQPPRSSFGPDAHSPT